MLFHAHARKRSVLYVFVFNWCNNNLQVPHRPDLIGKVEFLTLLLAERLEWGDWHGTELKR